MQRNATFCINVGKFIFQILVIAPFLDLFVLSALFHVELSNVVALRLLWWLPGAATPENYPFIPSSTCHSKF